MGRAQSKSMLSQSIAEALGTAEPHINANARPGPLRRSLIYTSMALLAINPAQVSAVSLGELNVNSRLGQPLNASVPITLAAGESLSKNCVAPARGNSGIGSPANLQVTAPAASQPGTFNLRVTTATALHEPMYEIALLIDCPGTPVLLRQYVLMLDLPAITAPATSSDGTLVVPAITAAAPPELVNRVAPPARADRSVQRSQSPIPAGQPYRVRSGDTLSTIAARIVGRAPDTTWPVADLIFATNAQAFLRNSPDLIKLGSLINIPGIAELAGVANQRSAVSAQNSATRRETPGKPEPAATVPAPIPTRAITPVATSRPEVFVTEPEQLNARQSNALSADIDTSDEAIEPFVAQPGASDARDAALITPFLDEQPVSLAADNASELADNIARDPIPVVTTTPDSAPVESINPLLAIFVGMLLGLLVSLLTLRRKLIDAFVNLLRRRSKWVGALPAANADEDTIAGEHLKSFDTSVAESAFITQQSQPRPVPLAGSPESTYIVETSDAEATAQENAPVIDPGMPEDTVETTSNPGDDVLAQLFDEQASTLGEYDHDIFDPTGGVDTAVTGTFAGPTAEMPRAFDDDTFEPTEDLPVELDGGVFDPTAEIRSLEDDLLLDETVEMPSEPSEPTLETELSTLPSEDDDALSQTLQEALSLLERDFADEFTASQIIERSEISRSLDAESIDAGDSTQISKRKVTR